MDYSKLSDFEINSSVHNALMKEPYKIEFLGNDRIRWVRGSTDVTTEKVAYSKKSLKDYCNNPVDAWPIIDENNITIINDNSSLRFAVSEVAAYFNGSNHIWSAHGNGLRAAMITFLKMQESQNAKVPSERDS